nr:putative RNA polymerase II subunit B1 CTD phosphatase RPAP2 isoform X1 [Neodiprion pinetum]XP_046468425.1 putative RNA polymerase II subunit B1 CTD phosphatase RPAP2 isoform X1 [Neodiprion pinetum]XP_046468426.1 putative RNA polymerase II subunit B1 CTD phosphatase RPAP2 isoform X1 [Neodiprion pinetum]
MTSTSRKRNDGSRTKMKMSKEQLQLALTKKRQCDARALAIVERLIDDAVDQTWLLENVRRMLEHINRCHMDDVVEERAILRRCGYALCDNPLKLNINQKYHISTRNNKVYDVSRRKNFCSNNCYGATNYILELMLTSPLWLRNPKEKPCFQLLPPTGLIKKSTPGDEVYLGRENVSVDSCEIQKTDKAIVSDKLPSTESNNAIENTINNVPDNSINKSGTEIVEGDVSAKEIANLHKPAEPVARQSNKCDTLAVEQDVRSSINNISKVNAKEDKTRKVHGKQDVRKSKVDSSWFVERIKHYLQEWLTLDSLALLSGDVWLKQQKIDEITKHTKDSKFQKKYVELCQKIDSCQVDEDTDEEDSKRDLKPLPDYSVLKEASAQIEVKVRAFYQGQTLIDSTKPPSGNAVANEEDDSSTFMPMLGEREPRTLRRRIILEKLDKVLPEMVRTLAGGEFAVDGCISTNGCGKTVKALVNTFSLSASNVIPKPAEWNLLGLIFIKLLSTSEPRLRFLLGTDRASKYITMILMSYNLEPSDLDTLVAVATDIQLVSNKNFPKK